MTCRNCSHFKPAKGSALLRFFRLGWCFQFRRFYTAIARRGRAPYRAGWCPGCRDHKEAQP